MTIVYQLEIAPGVDDAEGEDCDRWFSSLGAAQCCRVQLIRENPSMEGHRYGEDFAIYRREVPDFPRKQLIIALLNRGEWALGPRELVVAPYSGYKAAKEPTDD